MHPAVLPVAVLSLVSLGAAPASADTLKVPKQYASIQSAVDAAGPGDIVQVSKGTYQEHVEIAAMTSLTLRAKKGDKVVIDGDGSGSPIHVSSSSNVVLERLRLRDAGADPALLVEDTNGLHVEDCRMTDAARGIDAVNVEATVIRDCRIEGVAEQGIRIGDATSKTCIVAGNEVDGADYGIHVVGTLHLIEKNDVTNANRGVYLGDHFAAESCTHSVVRKNEIENVGYGIILANPGSPDCSIIENTVKSTTIHGIYVEGDRVLVEGNKVTGAGTQGIQLWDGDDCRILHNKVKKAGVHGINVHSSASDSLVVGNKVLKSGGNGFEVESATNCFMRNTAKKSGGYDLNDAAPGSVYLENDFTTIAP